MIKENIDVIFEKIKRANVTSEETTVIAVTKNADVNEINMAIEAGIEDIGENRVQSFLEKKEFILPCRRHLIGHLQTNKVKYIVGEVDLIHSVDSLKLAEVIDKCAKERGIIQEFLLQINISLEESKFGLTSDEFEYIINRIKCLSHIKLSGLMTIAPNEPDPNANRWIFKEMRKKFENTKNEGNIEMKYLSMGMTNDYEIAVNEGANMVRVGRAIFEK